MKSRRRRTSIDGRITGRTCQGGCLESRRLDGEDKWMNEQNVFTIAVPGARKNLTGENPIGTRCVDANKGDKRRPCYRSRSVAEEKAGKQKWRPELLTAAELFSGAPPLEAFRLSLS